MGSTILAVFGQTVKAPSIPANPATISQNGVSTDNVKLQEQKGWLYIEPPPGQNIPSAQNLSGISPGEIGGYIAMGLSAYNSWQNKRQGEVQKKQGEVQVQQTTVQKEALKLQYDTMGPEKANAINNRPEIALKKVEELEKKAVETASKA